MWSLDALRLATFALKINYRYLFSHSYFGTWSSHFTDKCEYGMRPNYEANSSQALLANCRLNVGLENKQNSTHCKFYLQKGQNDRDIWTKPISFILLDLTV